MPLRCYQRQRELYRRADVDLEIGLCSSGYSIQEILARTLPLLRQLPFGTFAKWNLLFFLCVLTTGTM